MSISGVRIGSKKETSQARSIKLILSDIKKFQTMHLQHFNQVLDEKDAREQLAFLVRQIEKFYVPITIAQFDSTILKPVLR